MSTSELHVWTDDHDKFIARDRSHLQAVYKKYYGATIEEMQGDEGIGNWYMLPSDRVIEIELSCPNYQINIDLADAMSVTQSPVIAATAEEWAKSQGSGFLSSIHA